MWTTRKSFCYALVASKPLVLISMMIDVRNRSWDGGTADHGVTMSVASSCAYSHNLSSIVKEKSIAPRVAIDESSSDLYGIYDE